jgi:hypothetical protein
MTAGEQTLRRWGGASTAMALVLVAVLPAAATAKKAAKTRSSSTSLTSTTVTGTTTASCSGGSHVSGGGFSVSPTYNPATNSGLRSLTQVSHPGGKKSWSAAGGGYQPGPVIAGTFTAVARCESNSIGSVPLRVNNSTTILPLAGQDTNLRCSKGTHVLYGGYGTDRPHNPADPGSSNLFVVGSRRTGTRVWRISAFNQSSTQPTTLETYFACERNGSDKIGSVSKVAPILSNGRTSADAKCSKNKHVVGGGFLISPAVFPGTVPLVSIDENQPQGDRGWHIGAYEFPDAFLPAGSTLATTAYCR